VLVLIDQDRPATLEDELAQQHNLQRLAGQAITLLAARAQLYAIPDGRTVPAVVAALTADARVRLAQANLRYWRQGEAGAAAPLQYAHAKMSIGPAHELARGQGVLVAVIDSAVDAAHQDLAGVVVDTFDAAAGIDSDGHGTAIAGIISGQGTVRGVAPMARLLAVRAFSASDRRDPAVSSSAILLNAIEWSLVHGAQILNMSFVGPRDPAVRAIIEAALAPATADPTRRRPTRPPIPASLP
jgi:subtilisin family serine protease